jgi:PIN domain nuclease of toxin-antitoxin system
MKLLVDTHLLIWSTTNPSKLSEAARKMLTDDESECYFSSASIWEIAIKHRKNPDDMPISAETARLIFEESGCTELPVFSRHSAEVENLPSIHADPFDRMLVAQARVEGMKLITHDGTIPMYGEFVVKV